MQLQTYRYKNGWNKVLDSALDSDKTLITVFWSSDDESVLAALDDLRHAFPLSLIIGASGAGQIRQDQIFDDGLIVAVTRFSSTRLQLISLNIPDMTHSRKLGQDLAHKLYDEELKAVFVLTDGLQTNGSQLTDGINEVLPASVTVTGGLAGDDNRFEKTWVVCNGIPQAGCITAVGFYGDYIQVGYGSKGGWDRLGIERQVTRSHNNILYELDGKPALQIYKRYLGERADELPASGLLFPLELHENGSQESKVRTILAVDETEQSITFAGDLREGSYVSLMKANFDRLVDGASGAASRVDLSKFNDNNRALCIAISCVGRRLILKQRSEEELEATLEVLPKGTEQIGFYSYGEISSTGHAGCELHNQTMTLTLIWEANAPSA